MWTPNMDMVTQNKKWQEAEQSWTTLTDRGFAQKPPVRSGHCTGAECLLIFCICTTIELNIYIYLRGYWSYGRLCFAITASVSGSLALVPLIVNTHQRKPSLFSNSHPCVRWVQDRALGSVEMVCLVMSDHYLDVWERGEIGQDWLINAAN